MTISRLLKDTGVSGIVNKRAWIRSNEQIYARGSD
jgi:hypothetical protein